MEQYSGKKVLFILTGSTFLLLALVFNIPNNQKNSKASAGVCVGESELNIIAAELEVLKNEASSMPDYIPPTMPNIIPTSSANYPMTMPTTPTIPSSPVYTPTMPVEPLIPTSQTYPTYMPTTPIYPTNYSTPTYNYYPVNPTQP